MQIEITKEQVNTTLDKLCQVNSDILAFFFLINLFGVVYFGMMRAALIESCNDLSIDIGCTGDVSLIIVPALGCVMIILLHAYSKQSCDPLNNIISMLMIIVGLIILDGLIPALGYHFDITGISVSYWRFTHPIIIFTIAYLFVFYMVNFLVKWELKDA